MRKKKPSLRELPDQQHQQGDGTAAGHTYDYFKDRWDKFDVDAALAEADEETEYETEDEAQAPAQNAAQSLEPPAPPEGPAVQPVCPDTGDCLCVCAVHAPCDVAADRKRGTYAQLWHHGHNARAKLARKVTDT